MLKQEFCMGKRFEKFLLNIDVDRVKSGSDFAIHTLPWLVGGGFFIGGVYGLESFLAIDYSKSVVENLEKNKAISDAQKSFYRGLLGNEILDESEGKKALEKMKNQKYGKISDANSLLAVWKSVYDK